MAVNLELRAELPEDAIVFDNMSYDGKLFEDKEKSQRSREEAVMERKRCEDVQVICCE